MRDVSRQSDPSKGPSADRIFATLRQPALTGHFVRPKVEVLRGPDAGRTVEGGETLSVGTAPDNDLVLTDPNVSRYHLEFRPDSEGIAVVDVGSTNGTHIAKIAIERARVVPGATLRIGETVLKVVDGTDTPIELFDAAEIHGFVGHSPAMRRLMAQLAKAAVTEVGVLLNGETGVGKEVAAQALHKASPRRNGPFETIDCGALAPTLIASELFGHEMGAFTGADRRHTGAFERASGGTLFLDEIGELPLTLQTSLLGVLERRVVRRLGGREPIKVDVRVVSATHRDLRAEVNTGSFRADLFHRLGALRVTIPPLRERKEDLVPLVEHFLREAGSDLAIEDLFAPTILDQMRAHRWPGNVRELRNFVDHVLSLGEPGPLDDLGSPAGASKTTNDGTAIAWPSALLEAEYRGARDRLLREFEREYLVRLLERAGHNVAEAARQSKLSRAHLFELLKKHDIKR